MRRTNRNPLGACAITGHGLSHRPPADERLLGFDGPTGNTYGSIATVDYLLESVSAAAVLLAGSGAFVQDLLLWCTAEFGYLRLGDGFVQCSSIMPQKRNPVALEHARAIGSKALGQAQAICLDRPQHAVWRHRRYRGRSAAAGVRDVQRCDARGPARRRGDGDRDVRSLSGWRERAEQGWITVTELADTLTRDHSVPFKTSHAIATQLVTKSHVASRTARIASRARSRRRLGRPSSIDPRRVNGVLSPCALRRRPKTPGGPAPDEIAAGDRGVAR